MSLQAGLAELGIELTEAQQHALIAHLDLLDEWGARMNLTAIRDRGQQLTKHVLDSLTVLPWLAGQRVADLGSGAGFPGIPLAIADPARHFALIESTGKKCDFLRHVVAELGLANVEVVQARSDQYRPQPRFGSVVARAIGPLADLTRSGGHLVAGERPSARHERPAARGGTRRPSQRLEDCRRAPAGRARAGGGAPPGRALPFPREGQG